MKAIIGKAWLVITAILMIGAPSAYAAQKPYWSATPVKSPDYAQVHLIITHINYQQAFGVGKTKVSLSMYHSHIRDYVELTSHIADISKHVKPTELNTTLDVGYSIIPASLVKSEGSNLNVGIHVLGKDGNWKVTEIKFITSHSVYLSIESASHELG